jgi:hypothetical protein
MPRRKNELENSGGSPYTKRSHHRELVRQLLLRDRITENWFDDSQSWHHRTGNGSNTRPLDGWRSRRHESTQLFVDSRLAIEEARLRRHPDRPTFRLRGRRAISRYTVEILPVCTRFGTGASRRSGSTHVRFEAGIRWDRLRLPACRNLSRSFSMVDLRSRPGWSHREVCSRRTRKANRKERKQLIEPFLSRGRSTPWLVDMDRRPRLEREALRHAPAGPGR